MCFSCSPGEKAAWECCVAAQCCWHSGSNAHSDQVGPLSFSGLDSRAPASISDSCELSPRKATDHCPVPLQLQFSPQSKWQLLVSPKAEPHTKGGARSRIPALHGLCSLSVPDLERLRSVCIVYRNISLSIPHYRISQQQPWENGLWTRLAAMGPACPDQQSWELAWAESRASTQLLEK